MIFLALVFVVLVASVWWLVCLAQTNRDRRQMESILRRLSYQQSPPAGWYYDEYYIHLKKAFDAASLRRHHWLRFTFGDPRDLYPVELWPGFKRTEQ